jgi:hypothetical protein
MVRLTRDYKNSYSFEFDEQGLADIINYLENLKAISFIKILHDGKFKEFCICIDEHNVTINIDQKGIKLFMDKDEVDYFLTRAKGCVAKGAFLPAELCDRTLGNHEVSLYAVYKRENEN